MHKFRGKEFKKKKMFLKGKIVSKGKITISGAADVKKGENKGKINKMENGKSPLLFIIT